MPTALKHSRVESAVQIPDRLYFKISDVASICGVAPSVLRFWQTEFPQLKPNKSGTGQRLYRRRDVEVALEIKRLVHDEGYTIAGARQVLGTKPAQRATALSAATEQRVEPTYNLAETHPSVAVEPVAGEFVAQPQEATAAIVSNTRTELRAVLSLLNNPQPLGYNSQQINDEPQPSSIVQISDAHRKRAKAPVPSNDFALLFPVE